MKDAPRPSSVFLLFLSLYLATAAGYIDTSDANASYYTARAMVERFSVIAQPPVPEWDYYRPAAGGSGWATKMGLLTPALYVVPVVASKVGHAWSHLPETLLAHFFISLVNSFLTAAIVASLYGFFLAQGSDVVDCLMIAATAGLATLLFPYSKSAHREPVQAICLLACFIFADRARRKPNSLRFPALAGAAFGFGLLAKLALVVPLLPAIALTFHSAWRSPRRRAAMVALVIPILIGTVIWLSFSKVAFGNWFDTGYSEKVMHWNGQAWRTPFWRGIYLQLLSPATGLFIYNPILLLPVALLGAKIYRRKMDALEWASLAAILLQVMLYARWLSPSGHEALGPRYLTAVIPLFFLFFRGVRFKPATTWMRAAAGVLLVLSLIEQTANTGVKIQQYWTMQDRAKTTLLAPHWWANVEIFAHKITGKDERYPIAEFYPRKKSLPDYVDVRDIKTLSGLNFWWAHLARLDKIQTPTVGPTVK